MLRGASHTLIVSQLRREHTLGEAEPTGTTQISTLADELAQEDATTAVTSPTPTVPMGSPPPKERTPDGYHPDMTTVADALANDSAFEEHPFDLAAAQR